LLSEQFDKIAGRNACIVEYAIQCPRIDAFVIRDDHLGKWDIPAQYNVATLLPFKEETRLF
jgi:hypothetical protein